MLTSILERTVFAATMIWVLFALLHRAGILDRVTRPGLAGAMTDRMAGPAADGRRTFSSSLRAGWIDTINTPPWRLSLDCAGILLVVLLVAAHLLPFILGTLIGSMLSTADRVVTRSQNGQVVDPWVEGVRFAVSLPLAAIMLGGLAQVTRALGAV